MDESKEEVKTDTDNPEIKRTFTNVNFVPIQTQTTQKIVSKEIFYCSF